MENYVPNIKTKGNEIWSKKILIYNLYQNQMAIINTRNEQREAKIKQGLR